MLEIDPRSVAAIIISVSVASLLAVVLYRQTVPRLPRNYRLLLGCLRWFAILIIMLLITTPKVTLVRSQSRQPVVGILVDESQSMQYPDSSKIQLLESHRLLSVLNELSDRVGLKIYGFSDEISEVTIDEISALEYDGSRTDIAGAIKAAIEALGTRPSALVLISDGSNNYGDDPVYYATHLSIPIHCIATVSKEKTPDVVLERVEANDVAYAGSAVNIWVDLSSNLGRELATKITVSDSTGIVHSGEITIPPHGARTRIPLRLEAGDVGIHRFKVRIEPFEGEKVVVNNQSSFAVRVIKGKMRVCLAAAQPSWDFAFARRALVNNDNIDVSTYLAKPSRIRLKGGVKSLKDALASIDVLVVFRGTKLEAQYDAIKRFVEKGGGLLFVSGEPFQKLFGDLSPFSLAPQTGNDVRMYNPVVTSSGQDHEIMRVGMESPNFAWSRLPPVPAPAFITGTRPGALTLLDGKSGKDRVALLAISRFGAGRVAALSCFDLWKWDLAPKGFGMGVNVYDGLLINIITWLVEKSEVKPLAVSTSKLVYLQGEPIDISAKLLGKELQPIAGAELKVAIGRARTGEVVLTADFTDKGNGNYSVRIEQLPPGEYVARVRANDGGNEITQLVHFDVEERGLEDANFDGDLSRLERLASATGGRLLDSEEIGALSKVVSPGKVVVRSNKTLVLKLNLPTFALLAVIFGLEWLMRKRKLLV